MAKGIDDVRQRLERAAAALAKLGVAYAVVGGNAVAAWVSRVDESAVRNTGALSDGCAARGSTVSATNPVVPSACTSSPVRSRTETPSKSPSVSGPLPDVCSDLPAWKLPFRNGK